MEGYPTITAVRNYLKRDGQIRIDLPDGYRVTDVKFQPDDPESISIDGRTVVIRVGHTMADISLSYAGSGHSGSIVFPQVQKLNNWNRLTFRAEAHGTNIFAFEIDENGVSRRADAYEIQQLTEQ
ncbi:MAG: hypothetical protein H8M99_13690 [Gloeobacteraceae cyanobacterium ES-bin-144]|nr:hypothetical protein [Verrucomicrobiales bacterium]